jgi:hypothetical protein
MASVEPMISKTEVSNSLSYDDSPDLESAAQMMSSKLKIKAPSGCSLAGPLGVTETKDSND